MSRSYAQRICGKALSTEFDAESGVFKLEYVPGNCKNAKSTEIYLSEDFYYPNGFKAEFTGCENCKLVPLMGESKYYYEIRVEGSVSGSIALTVAPS